LLVAVALALTACTSNEVEPETSPSEPPSASPELPVTEAAPAPDEPAEPTEPTEDEGLAGSAGPPDVADPPEPEVPEGRDDLIARTQRVLAEAVAAASDAHLAVLVTDEHGREIVSHRPDDAVLPASTLKVVTAAALLMTVGPDATFTTRVEATAPVDGDGTLRGDLVLVGGGDPALATDEYGRWVYPARPRTPLAALADELVELGLTELQGDVVGVAPGYVGPARAEGWPDRYFSSFDARYASGLTVDAGLRTILTYPEPDEPEEPEVDEELPDIIDELSSPEPELPPAADDEVDLEPPPEDLGPPDVTVDHVLDPAAHATAELVRLLEERDVVVHGEARTGEVEAPIVGRVASVQSPPMEELLRFAVQRSDNQLTDGLFRAIGRIRTGEGSWSRGDRALRQVLDRFDIDHSHAFFADGSGLSRDDRVTARLLVDLDRHMMAGRHARTWRSLMAVMGESGTLRDRLPGTVAAGRFHGKTGTLRDVIALSGTVSGDDGPRYHLAVIANEADGSGRWVARTLTDELVLQLSADVAGCDVTLGEPPEAAREITRSTIRC
jgi:serine-type D-Ala-D-Ala carboxypeptidase/endopeptidase (penicillin-binding protein 4)